MKKNINGKIIDFEDKHISRDVDKPDHKENTHEFIINGKKFKVKSISKIGKSGKFNVTYIYDNKTFPDSHKKVIQYILDNDKSLLKEKTFKPTLSKPTKMGKKLNKHFNKELTKQSSMQQVQKPNIKIKEDKDDFAMKQSGYNDLGIGKLKTNRKKDLDPSFQNLNYIDESDNVSLGPIKRNINKKLITKKELIESTLKENKEGFILKEESIAEELMKKDYEIWKKLNIKSGNDLYPYLGANPSIWVKYEGLIKKMLNNYGFDFRNTISTNIRDIIENENYHSLNQAIETLRYGEGKYGRDSVFFHDEEQLDETTTSSSSGQYQTPFAWAPNKKGWANAKKRWWGENSPNTGGSISKGGVVNIKDSCKGYSNSKTQCNSGDIGNITITEEAQNLITKLSKEYKKTPDYIKNLIINDHQNKKQLNENITDEQISQFVKKHLIKEGYLPINKEKIKEDTYVRGEIPDNEFYGSIDNNNVVDYIIKYENNELETDKMIELISYLIKSKKINNMDKDYINVARRMMQDQYIDNEGNILFSKIPGSTPKSSDSFSLNEKQLNEFKGMKPVFKNKETGEFWELSEIYHNVITLTNLKDISQTIKVDGQDLKNNYIKLGSGLEENTGPDTSGLYGSYKDVEGDISLMSPDIT